MALAISEPVAELIATTNASSYSLGAFTPSANAFLALICGAMGQTSGFSISGGGLNWFSLLSNPTALDSSGIWCAQCPASPVSTTITMTCNAASTGVIMMAFMVTGHDLGITPIRQFVANSGAAATNPSVTFPLNLDTTNGYVAGWIGTLGGSNVSTPPTSWTEIADAGFTAPVRSGSAAFRVGGETGTTVTFTVASQNWGCYGIEFYLSGNSTFKRHLSLSGVG